MPDDRPDTPSTAAARPEDVAGRGIGARRTAPPSDVPVARPVVRDASGDVRRAVAETVSRAARERIVGLDGAGGGAPGSGAARRDVAPSTELAGLLARVREAVAHHVTARRAAGTPVERVLAEVKALVHAACACEGLLDPADPIMAQVVRWTIAAYYEAPRAD